MTSPEVSKMIFEMEENRLPGGGKLLVRNTETLDTTVNNISTFCMDTFAKLPQDRIQASNHHPMQIRFSFSESAIHPVFVHYCDHLKSLRLTETEEDEVNRIFLRNLSIALCTRFNCNGAFGKVWICDTEQGSTNSTDLILFYGRRKENKITTLGSQMKISKELYALYKQSEGKACITQKGYQAMMV